ncbi:hypothetical protein VNI00_019029 [Paramarasmius palmivorus]|uniref:F-box domain-containing protein n=1 Tax=Paramarasmius palmivorus TaxID=297713 RepID=A0AAW0ATH1_9AGAR
MTAMPPEENGSTTVHPDSFVVSDSRTETRRPTLDHNSKSPIFRLPIEVLAYIFQLCVPTADNVHHYYYPRRARYRWLAFTHVCRFWRTIAIENPMMWSQLDFNIPELAREMIQRSNPSPMDIHFSLPSKEGMTKEDIDRAMSVPLEALSCAPRIRVLKLELSREALPLIQPYMINPMPSLQTLSISCTPEWNGSMNQTALLGPNFLGGHEAPDRLTRLQLERCHTAWTYRAPFTNLILLHIDGAPGSRPTEEAFYAMLRRSPQLKDLKLGIYALPRARHVALPPVAFPKLDYLSLQSSIPEIANCRRVVDNISFPTNQAAIKLSISSPDNIQHVQSATLSDISSVLGFVSRQARSIMSVSLYPKGGEGLDCEAWCAELLDCSEFSCSISGPPDFSIQLKTRGLDNVTAAIRAISRTSESISALRIGGFMPELDYVRFLEPLVHLSQLKRLFVVSCDTSAEVLAALSTASVDRLAMPALEVMVFIDIQEYGGFLQSLIAYLDMRIEYGAHLPMIMTSDNEEPISYRTLHRWMLSLEDEP